MPITRRSVLFSALLVSSIQFGGMGFAFADTTLLNVSYDPTRELYKEFNEAFAAKWKADTGETVTIRPARPCKYKNPSRISPRSPTDNQPSRQTAPPASPPA